MHFFKALESSVDMKTPKTSIAFYGPTGVGKTTLLLNIARTIQKKSAYKPSICVLDLDVLFPTTGLKLEVEDFTPAAHTIYDVLKRIDVLETDSLPKAMNVHQPSGIHFINHTSNLTHDHRKLFTFENVKKLIERCEEQYDLVLIDLSSNLRDDATMSGLAHANTICHVITDDIAHLVHSRNLLSLLKIVEQNAELPITEKVSLLLNRKLPKNSIPEELVQSTLFQRPILGSVVEKQEVGYHHNYGNFVCDYDATFRKDIEKIACKFYPFDIENLETETKVDLKRSKENWIRLYGSEHLKNCIAYGYNSQRLYVEERVHHEFNGWEVDFDESLQLVSRSCPTPEALALEIAIRNHVNEDLNIRVMWDKRNNEELLVIQDYLEKYRLFKRLS